MRAELVHTCFQQIQNLNPELIEVKLRRQYVEKYKKEDAFLSLSEEDKTDLIKEIAPLVQSPESDEFAKRFDNFIYGMMLGPDRADARFQVCTEKQLCDTAALLERKASIPQVREKLPVLKEIQTDAFWGSK